LNYFFDKGSRKKARTTFSIKAQEKKRWVKKNNFPSAVIDKSTAFSTSSAGYAGTGISLSSFKKYFWEYDTKRDQWRPIEVFPGESRISSVSFSIGKKGYVGTGQAGFQGMREGTKDFWEYDPQINKWVQKADFPGEIRYGAIGFSIRDKGYVTLGRNKTDVYKDLWEYDPQLNTWTKKADFPGKGREDAVVFVIGNEAYILLGQKKEITPSLVDCWKYDPRNNEWKQMPDFPGRPRAGAFAFGYKNKGYVGCGLKGTFKRYDDFWEFNSYTNKWKQLPDVPFGPKAFMFSFLIGSDAFVGTGNTQIGVPGFEMWSFDCSEEKNNDDQFSFGGSLLLGKNRIPLSAVEVTLLNSKNEEVKTVSTGLFGSFLLLDLANKEEYTLSIKITDPQWKTEDVYLVNRENETIAIINGNTDFKYRISSEEKNKLKLFKVDPKNIRMDLSGKLVISNKGNTPLANATLSLINDQEQIIQNSNTDKDGNFVFNYLPADTSFYLSISEKSSASLPKGSTLMLMDDHDNIIAKSASTNPGFTLSNIPPEYNKLAKLYTEDPWLEATFGKFANPFLVVEKIYFKVAEWELESSAKAILNKLSILLKKNATLTVEISAHTDSRGEASANMALSEKRANEAKKYILSHGIKAERIVSKGFGETHLLNQCLDEVPCSEEDHAKNRRMEFKINRNL